MSFRIVLSDIHPLQANSENSPFMTLRLAPIVSYILLELTLAVAQQEINWDINFTTKYFKGSLDFFKVTLSFSMMDWSSAQIVPQLIFRPRVNEAWRTIYQMSKHRLLWQQRWMEKPFHFFSFNTSVISRFFSTEVHREFLFSRWVSVNSWES